MRNTFDNWVIVQAPNKSHYRILAGSSGGYLHGSSWRLNSGIVRVEPEGETHLLFYGSSGSVYLVNKTSEMIRMNIAPAYTKLVADGWKRIEDQDWLAFDWGLDEVG